MTQTVTSEALHPLEFDLRMVEPQRPLHVLIIDDDRMTLDVLEAVLSRAGFMVSRHDTAFGSAHVIRRARPDVVLMDVEMNDLRGETVITHLRRGLTAPGDAPDTEFILYSGTRCSELDGLCKRVNALGSIEKDGDFQLFLAKFTLLLHRCPTLARLLQSAFLRGGK